MPPTKLIDMNKKTVGVQKYQAPVGTKTDNVQIGLTAKYKDKDYVDRLMDDNIGYGKLISKMKAAQYDDERIVKTISDLEDQVKIINDECQIFNKRAITAWLAGVVDEQINGGIIAKKTIILNGKEKNNKEVTAQVKIGFDELNALLKDNNTGYITEKAFETLFGDKLQLSEFTDVFKNEVMLFCGVVSPQSKVYKMLALFRATDFMLFDKKEMADNTRSSLHDLISNENDIKNGYGTAKRYIDKCEIMTLTGLSGNAQTGYRQTGTNYLGKYRESIMGKYLISAYEAVKNSNKGKIDDKCIERIYWIAGLATNDNLKDHIITTSKDRDDKVLYKIDLKDNYVKKAYYKTLSSYGFKGPDYTPKYASKEKFKSLPEHIDWLTDTSKVKERVSEIDKEDNKLAGTSKK